MQPNKHAVTCPYCQVIHQIRIRFNDMATSDNQLITCGGKRGGCGKMFVHSWMVGLASSTAKIGNFGEPA